MAARRHRRQGGQAVKIVVTGPFAAGKTTLIRTISEITVLSTERGITDDTRSRKAETTVAMDFGRITIDRDLVLYLFGTPGQDRFGFMWNDLVQGALGAVVLVDSRRIEESFPALDYFENRGVPFVVAVNRFGGELCHTLDDIREALSIASDVPVVTTDARGRAEVKSTVLSLLDVVLSRALSRDRT
jgi:signal recognition particle receptor subunit beta